LIPSTHLNKRPSAPPVTNDRSGSKEILLIARLYTGVKVNTEDRVPILNFLSDDEVSDPPATRKKEGLSTLMETTKVGKL
jgi:hypothetical protein